MSTPSTDLDEIHRVHHDATTGEPLSDEIVDAVASLADADPDDLPPLESRINVAALDGLWDTEDDRRPSDGCLTFTYEGYAVVVRSTGTVFLRETG